MAIGEIQVTPPAVPVAVRTDVAEQLCADFVYWLKEVEMLNTRSIERSSRDLAKEFLEERYSQTADDAFNA